MSQTHSYLVRSPSMLRSHDSTTPRSILTSGCSPTSRSWYQQFWNLLQKVPHNTFSSHLGHMMLLSYPGNRLTCLYLYYPFWSSESIYWHHSLTGNFPTPQTRLDPHASWTLIPSSSLLKILMTFKFLVS